jgi:transposase
VKLIPPKYVKPFVKRGKSDAIDAEAICEAVQRPSMTFVATKSETQQGHAALHSVRQLLVGQRTQAINALRGHMSEFGVVSPRGLLGMEDLARIVMDREDDRLPIAARAALALLVAQIEATSAELSKIDAALLLEHRTNEASRRLETIPGVGPITASALRARIGDGKQFENGRHFAAWAGLVPEQNSSGGKEKRCGISKKGDRYLRTLFVNGAMAVVQQAQRKPEKYPRIVALLARMHPKAVAVAVANRTARVAWAILTKGGSFVAGHGTKSDTRAAA